MGESLIHCHQEVALMNPRPFFALTLAGAFASVLSAQSLYVLDMDPSGPRVVEFNMIDQACSLSPTPVLGDFPTGNSGSLPCSTAGFAADPLGDIAFDPLEELIYVTDGSVLSSYELDGTAVDSLQFISGYLPGPMKGLGCDSTGSTIRLFATDGMDAVGFFGPAGCFGAGFSVAFPGTIPAASPGLATDIDYDPFTDTLWSCDSAGWVTNFGVTSGGFISDFFVAPGLEGIAVDDATGNLLISDGTTVTAYTPAGALAGDRFTVPQTFTPTGLADIRGIAFSSHAVPYGIGSTGLGMPAASAVGSSYLGNSSFEIELSGVAPGAACQCFWSTSPVCPVFLFGPSLLPVNVLPPLQSLAPAVANASGFASTPAPLPASLPVGFEVHMQWLAVGAAGLEVSAGLAWTTCMP